MELVVVNQTHNEVHDLIVLGRSQQTKGIFQTIHDFGQLHRLFRVPANGLAAVIFADLFERLPY
jgi:hypothetical protein